MIELYDNLSAADADLCGLVLKASGIPYRVKKGISGWGIWVEERDYMRARQAVRQYYSENREAAEAGSPAFAGLNHGFAGIWAGAVLALVYFAVDQTGEPQSVWSNFGASARQIVDGEIYRTVTALMLHADPAHLVGNVAGMAIFATAVCQVAGWGLGMLLVLLSGAVGNFTNAIMYESGHLSIGASTAVFGAIGILSGYQFFRKRQTRRQKLAAWLPLACGVALLGFLGSGAHVDLAAHLFGFLSGIFIGIGYAMVKKPVGLAGQWVSIAAVTGVILMSWGIGCYLD